MAEKKEVYKVKPLNENKKNIIAALIDEYDIRTANDIQAALRELLGGTIKSMMEAEVDEHLGYANYERSEDREPRDNYRNGTKKKNIRSSYGEFQVDVPQDRNSTFEPQIVKNSRKMSSEGYEGFSADLTTIYLALSEEPGRAQLERVAEKWEPKYPNAMKSWAQNWDVISPKR